jgi:hypothetical protein
LKKHHRSHKPGLISTGISGLGLAIAFNQGIYAGINSALSGAPPQTTFKNVLIAETGFDPSTGQFSPQLLGVSIGSKVLAFVWLKLSRSLVRRMRFSI